MQTRSAGYFVFSRTLSKQALNGSPENKKPTVLRLVCIGFAERGGFEPPVQLPVRQFSKLVVSATHPSLLFFLFKATNVGKQVLSAK
jgi:hypothetical protein